MISSILFFRLIMFLLIVMSIAMTCYMLRVRKHDTVLYKFCQLRRDIMVLMREENYQMSRDAYWSLRDLLGMLNIMIHEYESCKVHIFNIRRLAKVLRELQATASRVEAIRPTTAEVAQFHRRFMTAMFFAFFAYTPLIKSEITLSLLVSLLNFLTQIGLKRVKSVMDSLVWLHEEVKKMHNGFDHMSHA